MALAEFKEYGEAYAKDTVTNAQAFAAALASEGFTSGRGQGLHRLSPSLDPPATLIPGWRQSSQAT